MTTNQEFKHLMVAIITTMETVGIANKEQASEMAKIMAMILFEADSKELSVYEYFETVK